MSKSIALVVTLMMMVLSPAFAVTAYTWTNVNANNDFADYANWGISTGGFVNVELRLNKDGVNKAIVSTPITVEGDLRIGYSTTAPGEVEIVSGGELTVTYEPENASLGRLRVGQTGGTGTVTISGGTVIVGNGFSTFSDSTAGCTSTLNISSGYMKVDRITFAQKALDTSTLNMTGGTLEIVKTDSPFVVTCGALRMGLGKATLNISENAVVKAQKLHINEGGVMIVSGNALVDITGSTDADAGAETLNFNLPGSTTPMAGKIEFNGGTLKVKDDSFGTLDYQASLEQAIASANIYTTVSGMIVDTLHDPAGFTTLTLIDRGADIDGSGYVDIADLAILCRDWLLEGITPEPNGDIDNSGKVDLEDMALLSAEWHS